LSRFAWLAFAGPSSHFRDRNRTVESGPAWIPKAFRDWPWLRYNLRGWRYASNGCGPGCPDLLAGILHSPLFAGGTTIAPTGCCSAARSQAQDARFIPTRRVFWVSASITKRSANPHDIGRQISHFLYSEKIGTTEFFERGSNQNLDQGQKGFWVHIESEPRSLPARTGVQLLPDF
jgi:hypothetical protein